MYNINQYNINQKNTFYGILQNNYIIFKFKHLLTPFLSILLLNGCGSTTTDSDLVETQELNNSPIITNISINDVNNGSLDKGDILRVEYVYFDKENDPLLNLVISWYRDGLKIDGFNELEYEVTANDRGSTLKVGIIPIAARGINNLNEYYSEVVVPMIEANNRWKKETWILPNDNAVEILTGFDGPYGLSVHEEQIYISDIWDHKVIKMSSNFKFDKWLGYSFEQEELTWSEGIGDEGRYDFENPPMGQLNGPHAVAFSRDNQMYVADFFGKNISIFDEDLNFLKQLLLPHNNNLYFKGPANVYIGVNDNIYVCDWIDHRVFIFDRFENFKGWLGYTPTNIEVLKNNGIPLQSDKKGGFHKPHMVAIDDLNNTYIADQGNNRIQKLSNTYDFVGVLGFNTLNNQEGWSTDPKTAATYKVSGFNQPLSIAINKDNLIITDHGNFRILKYSLDGSFLGWIGGLLEDPVTTWSLDEYNQDVSYDNAFIKAPYDAKYFGDILLVADGHRKHVLLLNPDSE